MILATLCYVKNNGKTLMIYRHRKNDIHEGKYNGLGGKFNPGESPEDCITREVKEESGLTIHNPRLRGILSFPGFMQEDWIVFVYTANEFSGELKSSEEGNLHWVDDSTLLNLSLWESDKYFLGWIQENKFFSA